MAVILNISQAKIVSVHPSATVKETVEKMAELDIRSVLVMEKTELVGIFSEHDLLKKVVAKGLSPESLKIGEVMTTPPKTILPTASREDALQLMHDYRLHHLPVVDKELGVRGVLSLLDLLYDRIRLLNLENKDLANFLLIDGPGGD